MKVIVTLFLSTLILGINGRPVLEDLDDTNAIQEFIIDTETVLSIAVFTIAYVLTKI